VGFVDMPLQIDHRLRLLCRGPCVEICDRNTFREDLLQYWKLTTYPVLIKHERPS
jgi:hypothetical protein